MKVALLGLTAILIFKLLFDSEFNFLRHILGDNSQEGEWRILLNLHGIVGWHPHAPHKKGQKKNPTEIPVVSSSGQTR